MAGEDPKKKQMEYIAIALLVIVALFIGLNRFKKKDKVNDEVFSRKEFNEKWKEVSLLEKTVPEPESGIAYQVESKKDPFRSFFEADKPREELEKIVLPEISIQGMVWNSARPQVIIDNKVYDAGDTIEGETESGDIKIENITKDGVHLKYKGKKFIKRTNVGLKD